MKKWIQKLHRQYYLDHPEAHTLYLEQGFNP
jgi:hypothetical protein